MSRLFKTSVALMMMAGLTFSIAKADQTFGLDFRFSGLTPAGSSPWLTATFNDIAGGVQLTMSSAGMTGSESVDSWYFNLDPGVQSLGGLAFTRVDASAVAVDAINVGVNSYKADGDGFFDIAFDFAQCGADRFNAGESVIYNITGIPGLNASMFNYKSVQGGGNGTWYTAANVQGIPLWLFFTGNGWIGDGSGDGGSVGGPGDPVPEPSTILVLASFVGLAIYLKRRYSALKLAVA